MIIQSLLDTDLYKFTMMQVVLHHFPGAQAEYRFKCRTEGVDLRPDLEGIERELVELCRLRFRDDELGYLRSLRFMKSDFVDFLGLFQFNEKYVQIGAGEKPGEIDITVRGPWLHTIMYEIPLLAIVSELYFQRTQPRPDLAEGRRRLQAKIGEARAVEPELGFKISDYGTRRRFSRDWQEEVLQTFKREIPQNFAGTSNVWFAMRNNLRPLGTMAHEYMQACQALGPRLRDSQTFAFDKWAQEYRGDLGIAVADTYGTDAFLRDFDMYFCKLFDGARHDSGDPFEWGEKMIDALPPQPRRPAHQDPDLFRPAHRAGRHPDRAPLPRPRAHRVRHRHQPHQRSGVRADQHRHQDDRVQRPAGGEGVGFSRQDDQQGPGLPALPAPGLRPGTGKKLKSAAVAVLAACFALNMFGRGLGDTYAVFLLPLEREFGWTRSQLTGVYSVYLLVNGFTAPLVGLAFDRLGPRWVFGAGVACLGAAFFLAGGLVSLWQFYLFIGALVGARRQPERHGAGLGAAGALVPRAPFHRARHRVLRGRRRHADLRAARAVPGERVRLALRLPPFRQRAAGPRPVRAVRDSLAPVRRRRSAVPAENLEGRGRAGRCAPRCARGCIWGLAQLFFCTATAMFSVVVQLVAFLVDAGFSPLTAATAYGMLGMLSAASVMGSGFLSDRFGYRQTATVSFAGTASGMALLLFLTAFPSTGLLVLFVAMFGLCMGVRGPLVSSVCAKYFAGANVATIYGTIYATNAIGAAFGSYLGGLLHDLTGGYRAGLALALVSIAAAAAPFWTVPALRTFR